jgi:hypothetical protein
MVPGVRERFIEINQASLNEAVYSLVAQSNPELNLFPDNIPDKIRKTLMHEGVLSLIHISEPTRPLF